jgi:phospholipid transport system substrate-binding protein
MELREYVVHGSHKGRVEAGDTRLRFLLGAFLLLLGVFAAGATDEQRHASLGPKELIKQSTEQLLAAVEQNRETIRQDPSQAINLVDEILSPHIDFERVTRLILGKYWRQITPEQRTRFIEEFSDYQLRTYAVALTDHTGVEVTYLPTRPSGREDRAMVRTLIPKKDGTHISVDYRLLLDNGGQWKVYDVIVEGVSLLTSYRATIGAEIERYGIEGLIQRLSEKNQ